MRMWPSQRIQHMLLRRSTAQGDLTGNMSDPGWNPRASTGTTSKIEIRHTRFLNQQPIHANEKEIMNSSVAYISGLRQGRHVTFTPSTLRAASGPLESHDETQENSMAASRVTLADVRGGENQANELVGQVAIQALCNRNSVLDMIGGDKCVCTDVLSLPDGSDEMERIKQLDPESQKEELYKLVIRMAEEREKQNQRLVDQRARQKLVATKPVKIPKVRHILCVAGRTMDGRDVSIGEFPNSFLNMKELLDLRKDPPGFHRFTARSEMDGFTDEEISFTNEGNILRVNGVRQRTSERTAKVATEDIPLPDGVYADTLRIGRHSDGSLIIQEPWKF